VRTFAARPWVSGSLAAPGFLLRFVRGLLAISYATDLSELLAVLQRIEPSN
jgi:hypothetical protein